MAGEWNHISLREAGVSLIDCDHRTPPATDTGYPYVAIPQLKEGRLDLSDVRRISSEHFADWTRKAKPQHCDVILSRRCNPGETAYVPSGLECALGQNLVLLRADGNKVFPPFLRWLVRSPDWWEQIGTFINVGAVFDSLKCADIPNFCLPIPPLEDQRTIAHILGTLDDKIELNRKMNETLGAMARALFKSWFVGIIENEIPDGWSESGLDKIAVFLNGLALQKFPPAGGDDLPVIKIAQLRAGNTGAADVASSTIPLEYIVEDGDILFSWSGSLEVDIWCGGRGALNQHLFKVTSKEFPKWFYFLWIQQHLVDFQRIAASKATTMGHIQRRHLSDAKVLIPAPSKLKAMDGVMSPLVEKIIANKIESRTLATIRDALLPKLMSGEIRACSGLVKESKI